MKSLLLTAALLASFSASALELKVMDVSAAKALGTKTTRFEVNLNDGTAGVSLTATRHMHRRGAISRTFEKLVPELSLVGNDLVLTAEGQTITCGTMGETRIFKRPVLNLSGNCDIVTKRNGNKISVILVAE